MFCKGGQRKHDQQQKTKHYLDGASRTAVANQPLTPKKTKADFMRPLLPVYFCLLPFFVLAQKPGAYNQKLADSLGADQYGMKMYVLVMLKTGSNQAAKKETADSLFAGHMKNINRLVEEGKLVVAGPLRKNDKTFRGIFILDVKSREEALPLLERDPAIREKLLEAELYEWYGSAALPMYLSYHGAVEKKSH